MANKHRGETIINLGGREYSMRPTFEALVEFEDKAGVTAFEALNDLMTRQRAPAKAIAGAFWAGIRAGWDPTDGKPPTFAEVGGMVQRLGVKDCLAKFAEFLTNAITGDEELEAIKAAQGKALEQKAET
jgi:hypothetical protein